MNELKKCLTDGGPCSVEQYFRLLYEKPHSPSWALLPQDINADNVSATRQPLVANKLETWPGSEDMANKKLLSGPNTDMRHRTVSATQELRSLFDAVELSWYSKVCSLVTAKGLQINGVNEDGMTPLDVALLLGDTPVARVLQHHGAVESNRYKSDPGLRYQHVLSLLQDTEMSRTNVLSNPCNSPLPSDTTDRKCDDIERRLWKYHSMLSTLKSTGLPKAPQQITLSVQSTSSIKLGCYEPADARASLITQYKIQWSSCPNFKSGIRTVVVSAGHHLSHVITGLNKGTSYYFLVQAGNIRGFGSPTPIHRCTPSHWSDHQTTPDYLSNLSICSNVLSDLRTQFTSLFPSLCNQTPNKYKSRNKSLSRIFTTPKYVKTLNRCLYLSVMHCTDSGKVLVTDADRLPTVEVEDLITAPSAEAELVWLFKLAIGGWPSIRHLRDELAPYQDVGGLGLRYKLLSAVIYLQECLGTCDIGLPYYRLVKKNGQLIILLIRTTQPDSTNSVFNSVHLKPMSTLSTSVLQPRDALDIVNVNMSDLQTLYSRFDQQPTPGLFVGLLLFKVKGDDLEIVVDKGSPLLPPFEYVREVSHVTDAEWKALRGGELDANTSVLCKQVSAAASTLLARIQDNVPDIGNYSLYTQTIIELENTSVILLIPPQIVAPLGNDTELDNTMSVPLMHYEILHNRMKHKELTSSVFHVTTHLNTCSMILSQMIRQLLSAEQMDALKSGRDKIKILSEEMSDVWGDYCQFSLILSNCMKDSVENLRPLSDLLQYAPHTSPTSTTTSITDTIPSNRSDTQIRSGIVRIYSSPDIPIGPPCIKLHITSSTSTRDVINSVLRKIRRQEGREAPAERDLSELCLVASVNNMTHQIPDHIQLLQLGQPWISANFQIQFRD